MHSYPPGTAPKLQLAVQQPSTGGCWNPQKKKKKNMSRDKEEAARRQEQEHNHNKVNPIPTVWMTHRLEDNNTKEIVTLLWSFWTSGWAFQPGDLTKGLGIPREFGLEGQQDLIIGIPEDWGKHKLQSWGAQTKFSIHQDPGERSSDPTGDWSKTSC